ncbi:Monosaccharide-sensing protein 2 [Orobanche gracilis]
MNGAVLVAVAATIGTLLQGWDNATIGGAVVYIKKEMELGAAIEGLIVAMSLIGATVITTCSGTISDVIGRRPMLIISSMFYFLSGLIMLWSPNVYVLLVARLLDGFGIGLAATLVPLYISETAPSEIRGLLNTLPQFTSSGGTFLSYCMIFGLSLLPSLSWRLMLGVLSIPSLLYFAVTVFYLPESPRWLVSKGKMLEAKQVLQKLRGKEDVSGEMALLVEGLAIGGETSIEEYIIGPAVDEPGDEDHELSSGNEHIKLYGPEAGQSWVAKPVSGQSCLSLASRQGSMENQNAPLMDPLVTLFSSVHEKIPQTGSMLFPNFGSMFSSAEPKNETWDEESLQRGGRTDSDENLQAPLISRQTTSMEHDMIPPQSHGTILNMRQNRSHLQGNADENNSMGLGGGWQLAWQWSEREGEDGKKGGFKKVYLHEEGAIGSIRGSIVDGEFIQAAALVSHPGLYAKELTDQHLVGPAMVHPSQYASSGPSLTALLEPGVKRALIVGVGIQMLQQLAMIPNELSGISGVLFYTPQILQHVGVGDLFSNLGIGSDSASFLISALANFLMLPSIAVAMRFVDIAGRRSLLLSTIPVLIVSLFVLVIANVFDFGILAHAIISTLCVVIYFCFFVMAFGPIPNILCSEIFPTRVRGVCIAICALVFWICDVVVTYTMPMMLSSVGLAGVFGIYGVVCVISYVFVYLKVPETKGMPLEVISEFFAVGAKQTDKNE